MMIFDFWKKKENLISFSEENISKLTQQSDFLGQILIENGLGFYVDYLSEIRISAELKDDVQFKKLVISRELFGGSGALWEIHIENQIEYKKFNQAFSEYIDILIYMGIKNRKVRQIHRLLPKLI